MIEKYEHYKLEEIPIDSLLLDHKNPRMFRLLADKNLQNISQDRILNYLEEYEDLDDLCEKIRKNGWDSSNEPWVIKENDKFIVKEGNRRVATLKILKKNEGLKFTSIKIKLYSDSDTLYNIIEEHHVNGPKKWKPIGQGFCHMQQNKLSVYAHLVQFCLNNNIPNLFEYPESFTTITECLRKSNSEAILSCYLDDNALHYNTIGVYNMKTIINTIIDTYNAGEIGTRKRSQIDVLLKEIKEKLKTISSVGDSNPSYNHKNIISSGSDNSSSNSNNSKNDSGGLFEGQAEKSNEENNSEFNSQYTKNQQTETRPKGFPVLKITSYKEFKKNVKVLIDNYGHKITKEISYKILKELSTINCKDFPYATISLLRSLIDALAFEDSDRTKHENLVKPFLNNMLKDPNYKEHKKTIECLLKEYNIISSVVHGQRSVTQTRCFSFLEQYYDLLTIILCNR